MPSSLQSSRLTCYSLAATAAAAGSAAAAVADATSGSFDISFGRSAGTTFFNGFDSASGSLGGVSADMGEDFSLYLFGFASTNIADASFIIQVNQGSDNAIFNNTSTSIGPLDRLRPTGGMVDAGDVWDSSGSNTSRAAGQIFFSYSNGSAGNSTWTNPNATGTKYLNFLLEDDGVYGWVQLDWDVTDANNWTLTIGNWAYSDDGPLAAGSTGAPAVPGLGGLAALAIGAAGVRGRRKRAAG